MDVVIVEEDEESMETIFKAVINLKLIEEKEYP